MRVIFAMAAAALLSGTAAAQDYTGNVDPSAYSLPTVMHSAINARAKHRAPARRQQLSAKARATCTRLPQTRARLGASDPRVLEIARLCRKAGYLR
jgi:hypothetical protein